VVPADRQRVRDRLAVRGRQRREHALERLRAVALWHELQLGGDLGSLDLGHRCSPGVSTRCRRHCSRSLQGVIRSRASLVPRAYPTTPLRPFQGGTMNASRAFASLLLVATLAAPCLAASAAPSSSMAAAPAGPSLYQRLGGYDALAAVTDDFIGRMAADPSLAKFFAGHSKDSLGKIRQHVVDQLCAATG